MKYIIYFFLTSDMNLDKIGYNYDEIDVRDIKLSDL